MPAHPHDGLPRRREGRGVPPGRRCGAAPLEVDGVFPIRDGRSSQGEGFDRDSAECSGGNRHDHGEPAFRQRVRGFRARAHQSHPSILGEETRRGRADFRRRRRSARRTEARRHPARCAASDGGREPRPGLKRSRLRSGRERLPSGLQRRQLAVTFGLKDRQHRRPHSPRPAAPPQAVFWHPLALGSRLLAGMMRERLVDRSLLPKRGSMSASSTSVRCRR